MLAGLVTIAGAAGDRIGHLRVFNLGLAIFTAGSLACSLAPSLPLLLTFRVLQGLGGCMLNPNSLSLITSVFTDARQRAFAYGVWGGIFGVSAAAGPIIGGALTDTIGWRSIFWVNIPIGVAALILSRWLVPESRADSPRPLDIPGQLLLVATLATTTYAIIDGPRAGWTSATTLLLGSAAVVLLVAFLTIERHVRSPGDRLCVARHRFGAREPAYHQHRDQRHAECAVRCRCGRRLDRTAHRQRARRRRHRLDRHGRQSAGRMDSASRRGRGNNRRRHHSDEAVTAT